MYNDNLELHEMWEASFGEVKERLALPGKARARGALAVSEFKRLPTARRVWPQGKAAP
jgi:hypothetical protein